MSRAINQQLWDAWRVRLRQQRDSGLSVAAFCAQENCSVATFYQWKRKLAGGEKGESPTKPERLASQPRNRSEREDVSPFFRVAVPQSATTATWIELTLGNGTVVRLPAQNLAALELVLRSTQHPA
jgi:hypothetical protein